VFPCCFCGDGLRCGAYGTFCYEWHIMKCNDNTCIDCQHSYRAQQLVLQHQCCLDKPTKTTIKSSLGTQTAKQPATYPQLPTCSGCLAPIQLSDMISSLHVWAMLLATAHVCLSFAKRSSRHNHHPLAGGSKKAHSYFNPPSHAKILVKANTLPQSRQVFGTIHVSIWPFKVLL